MGRCIPSRSRGLTKKAKRFVADAERTVVDNYYVLDGTGPFPLFLYTKKGGTTFEESLMEYGRQGTRPNFWYTMLVDQNGMTILESFRPWERGFYL